MKNYNKKTQGEQLNWKSITKEQLESLFINEGEWLKIHLMLKLLEPYGIEWDQAKYDTKEIEMIYNNRLGIGDK